MMASDDLLRRIHDEVRLDVDPYADQNTWDIARRVLSLIRTLESEKVRDPFADVPTPRAVGHGANIRIRRDGENPFSADTYAARLEYRTEGWIAFLPSDAYATHGAASEPINPESVVRLRQLLGAAPNEQIPEAIARLRREQDDIPKLKRDRASLSTELTAVHIALNGGPADDDEDDWDNPHRGETTLEAAERVMAEARSRNMDLESVTQLAKAVKDDYRKLRDELSAKDQHILELKQEMAEAYAVTRGLPAPPLHGVGQGTLLTAVQEHAKQCKEAGK